MTGDLCPLIVFVEYYTSLKRDSIAPFVLLFPDVNTPPSITNLPHVLTLPESTTGRLLVYTINYVDSDGDSIQFEIVSQQDAAGVFEIIPSSKYMYSTIRSYARALSK